MGSTVQGRTVQGCDIEAQLNHLLLIGRQSLPASENRRDPIAPPPKVAQVRKLIVQGLCCPWRHLAAVSTTDLDDGVPLSEVLAPYERMIAYLRTRAAEQYIARDKPAPALMQRTHKEAAELVGAMLRYASSPDSSEAAEAVIREAADLPPVVSELQRACHLEVVRSSTRSNGRRMEVSR